MPFGGLARYALSSLPTMRAPEKEVKQSEGPEDVSLAIVMQKRSLQATGSILQSEATVAVELSPAGAEGTGQATVNLEPHTISTKLSQSL